MTVEIISESISMKVWYRAGIELATPGSAVRLASVDRQVTDCATRPGQQGLKYTPKSSPHFGEISHTFNDHPHFILLVRTVTLFPKIIFKGLYTEKNNYFLLYKLIQDLP